MLGIRPWHCTCRRLPLAMPAEAQEVLTRLDSQSSRSVSAVPWPQKLPVGKSR